MFQNNQNGNFGFQDNQMGFSTQGIPNQFNVMDGANTFQGNQQVYTNQNGQFVNQSAAQNTWGNGGQQRWGNAAAHSIGGGWGNSPMPQQIHHPRPVMVQPSQQLVDALRAHVQQIVNRNAGINHDLVQYANNLLMGDQRLFEGIILIGATYIEMGAQQGRDRMRGVNKVANMIFDAQVANGRQHLPPQVVGLYGADFPRLDAAAFEFKEMVDRVNAMQQAANGIPPQPTAPAYNPAISQVDPNVSLGSGVAQQINVATQSTHEYGNAPRVRDFVPGVGSLNGMPTLKRGNKTVTLPNGMVLTQAEAKEHFRKRAREAAEQDLIEKGIPIPDHLLTPEEKQQASNQAFNYASPELHDEQQLNTGYVHPNDRPYEPPKTEGKSLYVLRREKLEEQRNRIEAARRQREADEAIEQAQLRQQTHQQMELAKQPAPTQQQELLQELPEGATFGTGGAPFPTAAWGRQTSELESIDNAILGCQSKTSVMMQEDGEEEIPITFKRPAYNTSSLEQRRDAVIDEIHQKNAADLEFEDAFGATNFDLGCPENTWSHSNEQPKAWTRWGIDNELNAEEEERQRKAQEQAVPAQLDREALAKRGIISRGQASSGLFDDPFAETGDSHVEEIYNDAAIQNGSIKAMDEFAAKDHAAMYPSTHNLSLMDMVELGKEQGLVPTEPKSIPIQAAPEEVGANSPFTNPERVAFASCVKRIKDQALRTPEHRGIAPVYLAGQQRVMLIKSIGGGKIIVEGAQDVNYAIHETELLDSASPNGPAANLVKSNAALTRALATTNEAQFRKLVEEASKKEEDLTSLLADGPLLEMSGLILSASTDDYAANAQATLYSRIGEKASEISLDASINFNAFAPSKYIFNDDSLTIAQAITRAKTAHTVVARIQDLAESECLPVREINRLNREMTKEVNRLVQTAFHPDYRVDSYALDLDDLATILHENNEEDVRERLAAIYVAAAKSVFTIYTHQQLKKRLPNVEEETGLTEDEEVGIFGKITNVTLIPFSYADYPVAFEGAIGRLTKENLPKLYEVLNGVLTKRSGEGVNKFILLTEDHLIIEFFKSAVEDEAIYLARG